MADPERLMLQGKVQECLSEMRSADARFRNACMTLRQRILLFESPGDVDIALLEAAVADLAEARSNYLDARATMLALKERLGK